MRIFSAFVVFAICVITGYFVALGIFPNTPPFINGIILMLVGLLAGVSIILSENK